MKYEKTGPPMWDAINNVHTPHKKFIWKIKVILIGKEAKLSSIHFHTAQQKGLYPLRSIDRTPS
jgi:hypothetical protein